MKIMSELMKSNFTWNPHTERFLCGGCGEYGARFRDCPRHDEEDDYCSALECPFCLEVESECDFGEV